MWWSDCWVYKSILNDCYLISMSIRNKMTHLSIQIELSKVQNNIREMSESDDFNGLKN